MPHPLLVHGRHSWDGPVGLIDAYVDVPTHPSAHKVAIMGHPQPLLGGTAQHKIPQFLSKALVERGWTTIRPNFRGAGRTEGMHDAGVGESADVLHLIHALNLTAPGVELALVGFSFGAFVLANVASALHRESRVSVKVCLAGMPSGVVEGGRHYAPPQDLTQALVLHGECDERVPLSAVLDWARPSGQVVSVVPGADHFFFWTTTRTSRSAVELP